MTTTAKRRCIHFAWMMFLVLKLVAAQRQEEPPLRILYICTTLNEFDSGGKATVKGANRLDNLVLPVLGESVTSMISPPFSYHVDVYLVAGYEMNFEKVRNALPPEVGLEIWNDAIPLTYDLGRDQVPKKMGPLTRALARQHRYVIKDKLLDYDLFVVFEDDMLIRGQHVQQYVEMTEALERLEQSAPNEIKQFDKMSKMQLAKLYHGPMNKPQLSRTIPGFIRVEVLNKGNEHGTQTELDPIPISNSAGVVDPATCCHASPNLPSLQQRPKANRVFAWETGIKALGVREMPWPISWVTMLRGNRHKFMTNQQMIGDYWAGTNGSLLISRPFEGDPMYLSNQGGWMATRKQIWKWHTQQCIGGFLPPFDEFKMDGLFNKNVEFWSGGLQLTQSTNCNLQRIVSLDPMQFSKQLLYHTANNKQIQLKRRKNGQDRFVKINNLLGQLHTVREQAEAAKQAK